MLGCVPPTLMLLLMCYMPETPHFLLTQHQYQEAMAALRFLWGSEEGWEEPPVGAEHQVRAWERGRMQSLFPRPHTHLSGSPFSTLSEDQCCLSRWGSAGAPL